MITDWDDAYANAAHIIDSAGYPERWAEDAAAYRAAMEALGRSRFDVAYGAGARQHVDMFLPDGQPKGTVVFVHGGYWRAFSKDDWSHLARGAIESGYAAALPSYTLCPAARISQITGEIAAAITTVAAGVDGPIRLAGHSAGGHLVTRMVCDPAPLPDAILARIEGVVSISGVHDLRPLLRTELNETLRLDLAEARAESVALLQPQPGVRLTCWVGADERPEFIRQNALLANVWTGLGAETAVVEAAGRHHFDVIDGLADPDSDLTRCLLDR